MSDIAKMKLCAVLWRPHPRTAWVLDPSTVGTRNAADSRVRDYRRLELQAEVVDVTVTVDPSQVPERET